MPTRLTENDTLMDTITKMSGGNPGAVTVMTKLLTRNPATIFWLDQLEIYGSSIWKLYRVACHCSIQATITVIQAAKAGLIATPTIHSAMEGSLEFTEQQLKHFDEMLDSIIPEK